LDGSQENDAYQGGQFLVGVAAQQRVAEQDLVVEVALPGFFVSSMGMFKPNTAARAAWVWARRGLCRDHAVAHEPDDRGGRAPSRGR
jgi:hypothetical protein